MPKSRSQMVQAVPTQPPMKAARAPVYRAVEALRPSGAKFHHTAALSGADNPVGFCGDQALMVDAQKQHGFNKLCLDDGAAHSDDRFTGEYRRAFWDSQTSQAN